MVGANPWSRNPGHGSAMKQAREGRRGANRRGREKRRGRNEDGTGMPVEQWTRWTEVVKRAGDPTGGARGGDALGQVTAKTDSEEGRSSREDEPCVARRRGTAATEDRHGPPETARQGRDRINPTGSVRRCKQHSAGQQTPREAAAPWQQGRGYAQEPGTSEGDASAAVIRCARRRPSTAWRETSGP